ncbi:MAG TPA: DUF1566 domain-containing protein [Epsilonproteobacteria bacterium]|nr:DUF1566 domain-containing protein [Campylobacterota bacterium]
MRVILLILIGLSTLSLADFTRNGDIVTDNTTRLQWQDDTNASAITKNWQEAIEYCEALSLGGYSDWRLPNLNELKSIVDRSKYDPAIKEGFVNTSSGNYWSSTTGEYDRGYAWIVNFRNGRVNDNGKGSSSYVRCVRDGQ